MEYFQNIRVLTQRGEDGSDRGEYQTCARDDCSNLFQLVAERGTLAVRLYHR
jgi:hypothetical protein